MGERVAELRPDLLARAIELVGRDPFERAGERTAYAQPAIFCASIAALELAGSAPIAAYAGHSLGEVAALVAAGALSEEHGLRVVVARGRLMEAAARRAPGAMMAVRGSLGEVEPLLSGTGVTVANENAPRQVVLSGPDAALGEVAERLSRSDLRAVRLAVAGAFHTAAMEPAAAALRAELARIPVREPHAPVFSGALAAPFADVREGLVAALTQPVRWVDTVHALAATGIERWVDAGPGSVVEGLVRRILPAANVGPLVRAASVA